MYADDAGLKVLRAELERQWDLAGPGAVVD